MNGAATGGQIVLGGRIKPAVRRRESLAARQPVLVAGELLLQALRAEGVQVSGGLEVRWEAGEVLGRGCATGAIDACTARRLAALESPPLSAVTQAFLGPSQNWDRGTGPQEPRPRVWSTRRLGGGPAGRRGNAHTGLCGADRRPGPAGRLWSFRLRPGHTTRAGGRAVSRCGSRRRRTYSSKPSRLPESAGPTLSGRLRGLEGRVFAKTGTLAHVNALAGYLRRDNGREMVFAILTGNSGLESREVRDAVDELVRELVQW